MDLDANSVVAAVANEGVSYSYVLKVQHLIEECLVLYMNMEECVKSLAVHAGVRPVITRTVWKELEKENKEFFESYEKYRDSKHDNKSTMALSAARANLLRKQQEIRSKDA